MTGFFSKKAFIVALSTALKGIRKIHTVPAIHSFESTNCNSLLNIESQMLRLSYAPLSMTDIGGASHRPRNRGTTYINLSLVKLH